MKRIKLFLLSLSLLVNLTSCFAKGVKATPEDKYKPFTAERWGEAYEKTEAIEGYNPDNCVDTYEGECEEIDNDAKRIWSTFIFMLFAMSNDSLRDNPEMLVKIEVEYRQLMLDSLSLRIKNRETNQDYISKFNTILDKRLAIYKPLL